MFFQMVNIKQYFLSIYYIVQKLETKKRRLSVKQPPFCVNTLFTNGNNRDTLNF